MDNSFFAYLQRLELLAFFSGYPLLYAVIIFIAGKERLKTILKGRIVSMLPFTYALMGTLYLGLQLKNLYPDYSFENIKLTMQLSYLKIWGILSILFWMPTLARKSFVSLLHSLVFFYFLARDLFFHTFYSVDKSVVQNDMNIYTVSLLINLAAHSLMVFISFLIRRKRQ